MKNEACLAENEEVLHDGEARVGRKLRSQFSGGLRPVAEEIEDLPAEGAR